MVVVDLLNYIYELEFSQILKVLICLAPHPKARWKAIW